MTSRVNQSKTIGLWKSVANRRSRRFEPMDDEFVNAVQRLGVLQDENISGNLKCIALKHANVHDNSPPTGSETA